MPLVLVAHKKSTDPDLWRVHDDADAVKNKLSSMRFGRAKKFNGARGEGAASGANVGAGVSLNRQASGSVTKQLCGV